jgi:hypothetical protein
MSRKKKKQSWGAFPLMGAIPTGTVAQKGDSTAGESLKDFRKRYDAEQCELAQAPIKRAEAEFTQTMRELNKHARDFWGRTFEAIIPQLYSDLSKDFVLSLPDTQDEYRLDELKAAVNTWLDTMLPKTGYDFISEVAGKKFCHYILAQAFHGKDVRSSAAIQACFERLLQLDAFQPGELSFDPAKAPRPVEASPARQNMDELLNTVSGESTEGRKRLVEAVTDAAITGEFRACWQAFVSSIYENFIHVFTEQEKKLIYDTMIRRNKNFNRPADYDSVRVALVQSGNLPKHLLYPAEKLALEVENADMNDRNVRQEFARRTRELADQAS